MTHFFDGEEFFVDLLGSAVHAAEFVELHGESCHEAVVAEDDGALTSEESVLDSLGEVVVELLGEGAGPRCNGGDGRGIQGGY